MSLRAANLQDSFTDPAHRLDRASSTPEPTSVCYEELWLLGQPPLWRFLDFVEHAAVGGVHLDRAGLVGNGKQPTIITRSSSTAKPESRTRRPLATWTRNWRR